MLFNSFEFIFIFLPVSAAGFGLAWKFFGRRAAVVWLIAASLFFYGRHQPELVVLLVSSVCFNYAAGLALHRLREAGGRGARLLLIAAIAVNLGALAYFKYCNFFIASLNAAAGSSFSLLNIALPAGISFFTFERIAHLVDVYRGRAPRPEFLPFCGAAVFFPHLIAGPIVTHGELLPQMKSGRPAITTEDVAVGLVMFCIGLFKKVILANAAAAIADPVFNSAQAGGALTIFESWAGAFAFSFQIFFDFSGYTDMALGCARVLGFRLPLNFDRPYAATDINDFWRRWHITLSRFLREYLYIPLGGNRRGAARRYVNVMITMLLCGLWHGAGWTFLAWGGLHGAYVALTQALRRKRAPGAAPSRVRAQFSIAFTFVIVTVAWVLFRAETFHGAAGVLRAMAGANGISLPDQFATRLAFLGGLVSFKGSSTTGVSIPYAAAALTTMYAICRCLPTTQEFMALFDPALGFKAAPGGSRFRWRPTVPWAILLAAVAATAFTGLFNITEFIYFRF